MFHEEVFFPRDGTQEMEDSYIQMKNSFRWDVPKYYNIAYDACDKHAEILNKTAIVYDKGSLEPEIWTFRQLKRSSDQLANSLKALGVQKGDRVAVFLSQSPPLPLAHFATYKLGAIVVPLFTLFGQDAVVYRLRDSGARAVVTDRAHVDMILDNKKDLPHLEVVIVVDGTAAGALSLDELLAASSDQLVPCNTKADDPAVIIYTSGTTGPAKGALHAHRVLLGHLPGVSLPHELAPQPDDLFWTPADWAWIGGMFDVLFPALHWGLPVLANRMPKFDPEAAFELMARWQVRNAFLPPTAIKMMRQVEHPRARWNLALRSVASGGEPLGEETLRWGKDELGVNINEFYGQTECNVVLGNSSGLYPAKANSMGKSMPGHEVAVIDEAGNPVAPGTKGEIVVKAPDPVMFLEYWNRPEATARKFVNGWLKTGDLGYADEEGYFYFTGRSDDLISSAGYRIGPAEVEEVLVEHPAVLMAAVVGSPDQTRGEIVKAFIQVRDTFAASEELGNELQQWVKTRLGAHEYPREIEFVSQFPMTPSGKIQRVVLRRQEYQKKGLQLD